MGKYNYLNSTILFITIILLLAVEVFAQDSPLRVIEASNNEVLKIYGETDKVDAATQAKIFAVMEKVTDFDSISEAATRDVCKIGTEKECQTLRNVFTELLKYNSIRKLGTYRADSFDYQKETLEGETAVVEAQAYYQNDSVQLDYHLSKTTGEWMIVNYITDEIDTVRNYRRQFRRLTAKGSVADLIQRLQKKVNQYKAESGE